MLLNQDKCQVLFIGKAYQMDKYELGNSGKDSREV